MKIKKTSLPKKKSFSYVAGANRELSHVEMFICRFINYSSLSASMLQTITRSMFHQSRAWVEGDVAYVTKPLIIPARQFALSLLHDIIKIKSFAPISIELQSRVSQIICYSSCHSARPSLRTPQIPFRRKFSSELGCDRWQCIPYPAYFRPCSNLPFL